MHYHEEQALKFEQQARDAAQNAEWHREKLREIEQNPEAEAAKEAARAARRAQERQDHIIRELAAGRPDPRLNTWDCPGGDGCDTLVGGCIRHGDRC